MTNHFPNVGTKAWEKAMLKAITHPKCAITISSSVLEIKKTDSEQIKKAKKFLQQFI